MKSCYLKEEEKPEGLENPFENKSSCDTTGQQRSGCSRLWRESNPVPPCPVPIRKAARVITSYMYCVKWGNPAGATTICKQKPWRQLEGERGWQNYHALAGRKQDLTARSRGTKRRCPIPRSSSTRQAYSFTSLLLSSCISWDFLTGGASLGAGAGQGTPSSISKKTASIQSEKHCSPKPQIHTVELWEPALGLIYALNCLQQEPSR